MDIESEQGWTEGQTVKAVSSVDFRCSSSNDKMLLFANMALSTASKIKVTPHCIVMLQFMNGESVL